jgi:hypothetical protein
VCVCVCERERERELDMGRGLLISWLICVLGCDSGVQWGGCGVVL